MTAFITAFQKSAVPSSRQLERQPAAAIFVQSEISRGKALIATEFLDGRVAAGHSGTALHCTALYCCGSIHEKGGGVTRPL